MITKFKSGLAGLFLSALVLTGTGVPASAQPALDSSTGAADSATVAAEKKVLAELRANIAKSANGGDETARSSLKALNQLDEDKKTELARILLNEGVIQASQRPGSGIEIVQSGSCAPNGTPAPGSVSLMATTYNVTANCDSTFTFAGVAVSKVRLTGNYVTGSGVVLRATNVSAYTMFTYEPGLAISYSNFSHYVSGGRGYFQTTVTVTRSIFGWNHSTRSSNLRLVTNGPGVVSCGWV
ncbi:hypothetical protein ACX80N_01105 [Arthrobacter sp. MDT2-16]